MWENTYEKENNNTKYFSRSYASNNIRSNRNKYTKYKTNKRITAIQTQNKQCDRKKHNTTQTKHPTKQNISEILTIRF